MKFAHIGLMISESYVDIFKQTNANIIFFLKKKKGGVGKFPHVKYSEIVSSKEKMKTYF